VVWSHHPARPPAIAAPETLPTFNAGGRSTWVENYEFRFEKGAIEFGTRGAKELRGPESLLWMRDRPARPLDFLSLAALSDAFFIRAFVVRDQLVPVGTITLTTYFHTDEAGLTAHGGDYLLGYATAHTFSGGFADQSAQLWGKNGLLATSAQVVWYRE
jgi:hypothetical protein